MGDSNAVGWEAKIAYHQKQIDKLERENRGVRSSSISADTGHHYGWIAYYRGLLEGNDAEK
jgi:hypothetical protein